MSNNNQTTNFEWRWDVDDDDTNVSWEHLVFFLDDDCDACWNGTTDEAELSGRWLDDDDDGGNSIFWYRIGSSGGE